ncbi:major facilitator superfamily domain-containing protein [Ilyonectria robusta]|uniref:major facilitator superfamily domain-containing protein n=1 Tax=Ilyonectria robusta TaxID=1079257 RepID=UPI001E8DE8DD|nr:major facilitator superfamily domain-containing protein [Ilyonectria robusta]KAH8683811.1 major facilitator superfamily domain-containing protein [Ilyonectria robusta]
METTARDRPPSQDYDVVPGTVYIIEQPSILNGDSKAEIILIPTPADDLDDPLRWSSWRKRYHLFLLVIYSTLMTALGNWEASIYLNITEALGTSVTLMNVGTALTLLMLGIGNVFFTPLSHKFGRRFTYLSSLILAIASQIRLAEARNAGDFIGAHVLFGFGRAPYEALVAISIADVFFAHEIGLNMGIWAFGLSFGSSMGPICSGYMVKTLHWRWVYRWGAILCAVVWVAMYFTLEETRFVRPPWQVSGPLDGSIPPAERASSEGLEAIHQDVKAEKNGLHHRNSNTTVHKLGEVLEANSFRFQFSLWTIFPGTLRDFIQQCYRPLQLAWFPAIFWSGIEYGTSVSWISVLGTTTAVILSPSPYNFGNDALGLIWLSPLVGGLFGSYFAGPLNDQLMMFLSRRNRGWREPEFRLWSFLPTAIIMPAGLILYGVGAAKGLPWIAPIIGMGFVGFGLSVAAALTMAFVVDCYTAIDGEAVTTVILIRNIIGSALTFGIQPWIDSMGVQDTFIMVAILAFVITFASGLLIVWGKKMRLLTKAAYLDFARVSE